LTSATIRTAEPDRDAAACVAIYAPYVEQGATSFEEASPGPGEFAERIALHESVGFEPVGVYRRIGWKDGSWRDVGWLQLELQTPGKEKPPEPVSPEP